MDTDSLGRKALRDVLMNDAHIAQAHASELVNGKKTPSLDLALRIETATGIPPMFWRSENRGAAMWSRIQEGHSK